MLKVKRLVPFIGLGLGVSLILTGCDLSLDPDSSGPTATPNPSATSSPTPTPSATPGREEDEGISDELMELLDGSFAPRDTCEDVVEATNGTVINGSYPLLVKSLLELPPRLWSDALSTPLEGTTPEEMYGMLQRAICEEPVIGVSLAHLFAHLEINGTRVLDLQKTDWLKFANVDDSKIAELVSKFVPNVLIAPKDRTEDDYAAEIKAGNKYEVIAGKLVFLLSRYQLGTVIPVNSTHHYHLVAGGLTADGIPEVEVSNKLDNRPALVFYLTEKTECKPISVLAFNVGDKRPELAEIPESCEPLLPPPPPPPPGCEEPCDELPRKTQHTPGETSVGPAPTPSGPAADPEPVDTTPYEEEDTGTDLPPESGPAPGGSLGDD